MRCRAMEEEEEEEEEDLGFTMLLTSQVIRVAFYSEQEKSDKCCSEVLILA